MRVRSRQHASSPCGSSLGVGSAYELPFHWIMPTRRVPPYRAVAGELDPFGFFGPPPVHAEQMRAIPRRRPATLCPRKLISPPPPALATCFDSDTYAVSPRRSQGLKPDPLQGRSTIAAMGTRASLRIEMLGGLRVTVGGR